MLTLDDVRAAAETLRGRVHRTPLLGSRTLGRRLGTGAWLKAELFQRTWPRGRRSSTRARSSPCEVAGAAPVAALLAGKVELDGRSGVVAVVSGGNIARSAVADVMTNEEDA